MTIDLLRRLSGSTVAALFAVAIAAGCSETRGPVAPSGTGGDVGPIPTSPLCGATNLTAEGGGAAAGGVMPTPAASSRRSSRNMAPRSPRPSRRPQSAAARCASSPTGTRRLLPIRTAIRFTSSTS